MVISNKIDERKTTSMDVQNPSIKDTPFKQKLTAFACISFFPLLYLIGSAIVKYFG